MDTLPPFNTEGDLPSGVHAETLEDALARFGGGSSKRQLVAERLKHIHALATSTGQVKRFVVYGSFVTDKAEPRDVDVFMVMQNSFEFSQVQGEASHVFDHMVADNRLGASVFWSTEAGCLGGEDSMIQGWMKKRDGGLRGIVEIVSP